MRADVTQRPARPACFGSVPFACFWPVLDALGEPATDVVHLDAAELAERPGARTSSAASRIMG